MNTTEKGNKFELRVGAIIQDMIDNDTFILPIRGSEVLYKKGYYSHERKKDVIFDLAIELRRHPDLPPFFYLLIECKDTNRSVPVDDVIYFNSTVKEVTGSNVKAMVFATSNFDEGGLNFAKSNGIALIRLLDDDSQEWFVERTSPYLNAAPDKVKGLNVLNALLQPYFISTRQELFGIDNGVPFTDLRTILRPILEKDYTA
jgi:hypothetical protein